ncbi:hypothetical protein WA158_005280, partial [Blastocystis sp. Blastoise]
MYSNIDEFVISLTKFFLSILTFINLIYSIIREKKTDMLYIIYQTTIQNYHDFPFSTITTVLLVFALLFFCVYCIVFSVIFIIRSIIHLLITMDDLPEEKHSKHRVASRSVSTSVSYNIEKK